MPSKDFADYDAYLFDWDGNLAQTLEGWLSVLRSTLKEYGIEVADKEITSRFGNWNIALELGLDPALQDEFLSNLKPRALALVSTVPLYDHAKEVLQGLKAKSRKLALITSSIQQAIDQAFVHHGLTGMFDVVITGDMKLRHKPDPETLNFAMQKLGVSADQTLFLGDSDKDLVAASNAGVDSLLFYPDSHKLFYDKDYLQSLKPGLVISAWDQLKA